MRCDALPFAVHVLLQHGTQSVQILTLKAERRCDKLCGTHTHSYCVSGCFVCNVYANIGIISVCTPIKFYSLIACVSDWPTNSKNKHKMNYAYARECVIKIRCQKYVVMRSFCFIIAFAVFGIARTRKCSIIQYNH